MKASKTFNIGEYCKGGVITAEVDNKKVTIICREWDMSKGGNKSSDQTNAPEWNRLELDADSEATENSLDDFLNDLTSSYYAEQVMEWIKSKVTLKQPFSRW